MSDYPAFADPEARRSFLVPFGIAKFWGFDYFAAYGRLSVREWNWLSEEQGRLQDEQKRLQEEAAAAFRRRR